MFCKHFEHFSLQAFMYLFADVKLPISCGDDDTKANVEYGDRHDSRGFTAIISTRLIKAGEEVFCKYGLHQAMRTTGQVGRIIHLALLMLDFLLV